MSHDVTLAENRLQRKRQTVSTEKGHRYPMRKQGKRREIRSPLQAIFLKRVEEELQRQGLSRAQLAKRVGAPPQTTLNDVMLGADPRLETVYGVATALGIPAISLLTESSASLHRLPSYPSISSASSHTPKQKTQDRKKSGR